MPTKLFPAIVFSAALLCNFCSFSNAEERTPPVIVAPPVEVTAPRELDSTRTLPISSTRISHDDIDHADLQNTSQLGGLVPNMTSSNGAGRGNQIVGIRGLSNTYYFGDPTVGFYVDGVPIADARAFNIDLFDIDHIDVLRGPQMTDNGKGAEAGQINVVTQKPTNSFHGEGTASYGNYNTQLYRASVSGPIIKDKLLFRLSGLESRRDGYIKNEFDGSHPDNRQNLAGRLQLQYTPIQDLEITATLSAQSADDGSPGYGLLSRPSLFKVDQDFHGGLEVGSYMGALKAVYNAPDFMLTSVTSRQTWGLDNSKSDFDFTPANLVVFFDEYNYVQWSQEVRLASTEKYGNWKWIAGAYFEDHSSNVDLGVSFPNNDFVQGGLGLPFPAPLIDRARAHQYARTYAGFGQATYTAWGKLDVTFGLRVEHHSASEARNRVLEIPAQHMSLVTEPRANGRTDSDVVLPKLAIDYHIKPNWTVYGTVAEGYRPGGFSALTGDPKVSRWQPDFVWNFEAGMKSNWLHERLSFDLALFYDPMKDFQTRHQVSGGNFWVDNAKRARTMGGESQLFARPVKGLQFSGGLGYVDARYEEFHEPATNQDFDGNRILLAPKYTFNLAAQYHHHTGFFARAEYNGVGRYPFLHSNLQFQDAYQLFNAKLGFEKKHFGVYLYGKNLFNREYSGFGVPDVFGKGLVGAPGDPRTFGIMGRVSF